MWVVKGYEMRWTHKKRGGQINIIHENNPTKNWVLSFTHISSIFWINMK